MALYINSPHDRLYTALFGTGAPGVISIVGAGGKTSTIMTLARELSETGKTVVITTTTKMHPPEAKHLLAHDPDEVRSLLRQHRVIWAGICCDDHKMVGLSEPVSRLAAAADYVLIEADGARKHPLKMIDPTHEPVIPPGSEATIAVAGLDSIGRPIRESVHRPGLACQALGCSMDHLVEPSDVAKLLELSYAPRFVILNKADTDGQIRSAHQVASHLTGARCVITSYRKWGSAEVRI